MPVTLEKAQIYDPYESCVSQIIDDDFKYDQFHKKLASLPENLLNFIFLPELAEFVKDRIAISFNLGQNQSKEIAIIIMGLILADSYLGNVVAEIKNRLGVEEMKAKTIAGLIVADLFAPILEDLKKIHIEKFAKNLPDDRIVDLKNNL